MIYYIVRVESPMHGELFYCRCDSATIAAALTAAADTIAARDAELRERRVPISFTVEVRP